MLKTLLQKYPIIAQFSRFVVVGFMNTAIDFAVLNLLMWTTGIYKGKWIILLNAISFMVAVINSYFWNRFWTFRIKGPAMVPWQMSQFLVVSLIGVVINSSIVYGLTTFIPPFFGLGKELWANLAKAAATGIALIWNFLGYKFIVFRKS
jgi:putative flippase GtrA